VEARLLRASEIIETAELAGVDRAEPLDGGIELLAALKAGGAAIAIVTSNSSKTVKRWFDRHPGASIDAIIGRDSLLALKPAPDMLNRALELLTVEPSDAAYVGDSEGDVRAARVCGVEFYGIATTENAHDRLVAAGATKIHGSPAKLATVLKRSGLV
jgi:HAD superfamily hydrolase (TIGR01549 family)